MEERTVKPGGLYRHFKGGLYRVLAVATHSETLKPLVVYSHLDDGSVWARPLELFLDVIERDGKRQFRFTEIEDEKSAEKY